MKDLEVINPSSLQILALLAFDDSKCSDFTHIIGTKRDAVVIDTFRRKCAEAAHAALRSKKLIG